MSKVVMFNGYSYCMMRAKRWMEVSQSVALKLTNRVFGMHLMTYPLPIAGVVGLTKIFG